jgi:hypothetical protein
MTSHTSILCTLFKEWIKILLHLHWKNYFSQLLNVHRVSDVRQIEIHTAEPLVPDPSPIKVEIATENLKRYKSPGSDRIPAELIQAGGEILRSKIHKLIKFIWNNE